MSRLSDFNYNIDIELLYELNEEYIRTGIIPLDIRKLIRKFIENEYSFMGLSKPGKNGMFFNHQELFVRFMIVFAMKRMYIMDEAGSGKTKKIIDYIILLLTYNVSGTVDVYNYYNMCQSNIEKVYYIANNESLVSKFKHELVNTVSNTKYDAFISIDTNILNNVDAMTYGTFVKEINQYKNKRELIMRNFDHTLIIVDEAHNLVINKGNKTDDHVLKLINQIEEDGDNVVTSGDDKNSKFKAIYRLKDTKATVIFMSASALINSEEEMSSILSLIHGRYITMKPKEIKGITTLNVANDFEYLTYLYFGFVRADRENMSVSYASNTKLGFIKNNISVISYEDDENIYDNYNEGDKISVKLEVSAYKMSIYQTYYTEFHNLFISSKNTKEINKNVHSDAFYTMSEKLYVAVPITNSVLKYETAEDLLLNVGKIDDEIYDSMYPKTVGKNTPIIPFNENTIHKMKNLEKVSTIYYNFILNISKSLKESSKYADSMPSNDIAFSSIYGVGTYAVYLRDIKVYAIDLLINILEHTDHTITVNGEKYPLKFVDYKTQGSSLPKYAIITSDTDESERKKILQRLHNVSNFSGKLIKLVIFSNSVQGLNISAFEIHSLEFHWNMGNAYQSLYRIIRTEGLKPLENQIRSKYPEYKTSIKIYIYAAYPAYHLTSRKRKMVIKYYNDLELMEHSYNISKLKSVITKDAMLEPYYTKLRENSYDFNLNNYNDITKDDFCLINCKIIDQNKRFNKRIKNIRDGSLNINPKYFKSSLYINVFAKTDIQRAIKMPNIPYDENIEDLKSYLNLKYSKSIFGTSNSILSIVVSKYIEGEGQKSLKNIIKTLELAISSNYRLISEMYFDEIDKIEDNDISVCLYEMYILLLKLDIINTIENKSHKIVLYEYIHFWFIVRTPSSKLYDIEDYQHKYLINDLNMNMIDREGDGIIVFHTLNNHINKGNSYSIGRLFLGIFNTITFRYIYGDYTWNNYSNPNLNIYLRNMYMLKRYAELGYIFTNSNIAIIKNYTPNDDGNSRYIYRYYYYPNIGKSDKHKFRGNTSGNSAVIAMNMTLLNMSPSHYDNFANYRISHDTIRRKIKKNGKEYIIYLRKELEKASKLKEMLNVISDNLVSLKYNTFIKRLYKFYTYAKIQNNICGDILLEHTKYCFSPDYNGIHVTMTEKLKYKNKI